MSNQKIKSSSYSNFGGIDSKASPYLTGPMEFLDIINFDFQTPGDLSQRWGSTQYVGQTFAGTIKSLNEFTRLDGSSYVVTSHSGGIWFGATTGNSQGMSFTFGGATYVGNAFISDVDFAANSLIEDASVQVPYLGNPNIKFFTSAPGTTLYVSSQPQSDNTLSVAALNNYLFACDGNKFFKFDGVTTTFVGLPPATRRGITNLSAVNSPLTANGFSGIGIGVTGSYAFYASYVNNRGFEGPIWPLGAVMATETPAATLGGSYICFQYLVNTPFQYGISSINLYSFWQGGTLTSGSTAFWNLGYRLLANWPASGSTITAIAVGSTATGQTLITNNSGALPNTNGYQTLGLTVTVPANGTIISEIDCTNYVPSYCAVYQNRLFLAGFSSTPSTVWFSDAGEPEGYNPDWNFEVRTNDGDVVTCMRSYSSALYVFKRKSFHVLQGDDPNNFSLREVSAQYGCINNRCAVIYNTTLLFLDQKGVIMYNGANLQILSNKVQAIFDSMNYSVAQTTACMVHDNLRNQVLIAIPVNGSSTNNLTVVYDYVTGAWTKYDGFTPSAFAVIQGRNSTKNAFYGDTSGRINWFGSSFLADNGVGFTTYFKSRFLHDMGESIQEQYRRLYMDANIPSATLFFNINFFQDYGTSAVLSTTFVLGQFQNRIDFGISAKALAFEMSNLQTTVPLKIHGFTIESRMQRRV